MAWIMLFVAGVLEVVCAYSMKQSEGGVMKMSAD